MFYKYLTKQIGLGTNQLLSIRPGGSAPDLNYFRNKVSHLLELFLRTCIFRPNAGLQFLYSRGFFRTSVADRLLSFIY